MKTIKSGTIKRIHVNRQKIDRNRKLKQNEPTLTVQTSDGPVCGKKIIVSCQNCGHDVVLMDQDAKQLKCGARVYIETVGEITIK